MTNSKIPSKRVMDPRTVDEISLMVLHIPKQTILNDLSHMFSQTIANGEFHREMDVQDLARSYVHTADMIRMIYDAYLE